MNPPTEQLPGRYVIMERHSGYAAFRAVAAIMLPDGGGAARGAAPDRGAVPDSAVRGRAAPGDRGVAGGRAVAGGDAESARPLLVGFAYGFHGSGGQWWHDVVRR